jgi:hypothetical protein
MRRISLLMVIAALAALVPTTPVLAGPGCGGDWDLLTVDATLERVDERIYDATEWAEIEALIRSVDEDGDGLLCSKQFKPNQGQDKHWIGPEDGDISDYVVTGIQDNHPKGPKP